MNDSVLPADFADWLREIGFAGPGPIHAQALRGGVSSDIWRVDLEQGPVCVKRALPVLRVQARWEAPVERNAYEARWLRFAASVAPDSVPHCLASDDARGMLLMQYLPVEQFALWKTQLSEGVVSASAAREVGALLAVLHAESARRAELAEVFSCHEIFYQIRLAPYLGAAAQRHPDCATQLEGLIELTASTRRALMHGDVSPKNILIGGSGPVLLDAECACWGDPAFDLAFCLNHLLLKRALRPDCTGLLRSAFTSLWQSYRAHAIASGPWEPWDDLEARCARLLAGLLLARVDGKSPVEYLVGSQQQTWVRELARRFLQTPANRLESLNQSW